MNKEDSEPDDNEKSDEDGSMSDASEDADSDANDDEDKLWLMLFRRTAKKMIQKHKRTNDVLCEPHLSNFVEQMKNIVEKQLKFLRELTEESDLYKTIENEIEENELKGLDHDAAVDTAWNTLRFAIRKKLARCLNAVNNKSDSTENSDEDETDESGEDEEADESGEDREADDEDSDMEEDNEEDDDQS